VIADGHNRAVYLNSLFSPVFTIQTMILRRAGALPRIPFIVAPRGEFSPAALQLKSAKKASYLAIAKALGLYKDVLWQASSAAEERDIRRWCGATATVFVAPDVAVANTAVQPGRVRETKRPGQIKIVFISRVARMKNLDAALQMLSKANGRIEFNIYGPISEQAYWNTCAKTISALPSTVSVHYHGAIGQERVADVFAANHLFLMPTLGENYGHAIIEAMSAGCPVLISDRTPWRELEAKQVGWDIPLERPDLFQRVLQTCIDMDDVTYQRWSDGAKAYATNFVDKDTATEMIHALFERALAL
jgi:glycosyltransferase involved in cell wall biosynthesis